jgi:hypothetical protein
LHRELANLVILQKSRKVKKKRGKEKHGTISDSKIFAHLWIIAAGTRKNISKYLDQRRVCLLRFP